MTEKVFEALVGKVIRLHLPQQTVIFELGGRDLVADLYAGRAAQPGPRPEFGFGYEHVKTALEIMGLLKATFEVVKLVAELRKAAGAKREEAVKRVEVAAAWEKRLLEQGLPAATATAIANQHAEELAASVK